MFYNNIKIYTDGASRGNPGLSGAGFVIYDNQDKIIGEYCKFLGKVTNNQAEYQALILALEKAKKIKTRVIECYSDSKLMVEQLNRNYKVKNSGLAPLFIRVWNLTQFFKQVSFHYIPREKNKKADALANKAIDEY